MCGGGVGPVGLVSEAGCEAAGGVCRVTEGVVGGGVGDGPVSLIEVGEVSVAVDPGQEVGGSVGYGEEVSAWGAGVRLVGVRGGVVSGARVFEIVSSACCYPVETVVAVGDTLSGGETSQGVVVVDPGGVDRVQGASSGVCVVAFRPGDEPVALVVGERVRTCPNTVAGEIPRVVDRGR